MLPDAADRHGLPGSLHAQFKLQIPNQFHGNNRERGLGKSGPAPPTAACSTATFSSRMYSPPPAESAFVPRKVYFTRPELNVVAQRALTNEHVEVQVTTTSAFRSAVSDAPPRRALGSIPLLWVQ